MQLPLLSWTVSLVVHDSGRSILSLQVHGQRHSLSLETEEGRDEEL